LVDFIGLIADSTRSARHSDAGKTDMSDIFRLQRALGLALFALNQSSQVHFLKEDRDYSAVQARVRVFVSAHSADCRHDRSAPASRSEVRYVKLIHDALEASKKQPPFFVLKNEYLFGFEADAVVCVEDYGSNKGARTSGKTNARSVVCNIEIDGPSHRQPTSKRFTRLRDEYLLQEHSIPVVRFDLVEYEALRGQREKHEYLMLRVAEVSDLLADAAVKADFVTEQEVTAAHRV
jgi:hypothetical protein